MRSLSFLLALVLPLTAADDFGKAEPFRSGDVVCFVGDSITHGGTYHSIVALYYATRFPDRTLTTFNCGIGGDRASGIMADEKYRLNVDILGHKPTAATIMLGMNDIGHPDYRGIPAVTPEVEARRAASLAAYDANMQKLIAALQKSGARLTLITPSIYDETTKLPTASTNVTVGGNAALAQCAEKVRGWAKQHGTGLVDFDRAMNAINAREQAKDPHFTVVGPDRVHPGPVGHFVMAYLFLKAQGVPREVATIAIDAKKGNPSAVNCRIDDVKTARTSVSFTSTARALPLVVPDDARPALALVPFMRELNEEKLIVTGLPAGSYELKIDGQPVGEYTAAALATGVNLAENDRTPQYQQSAAATKLSQQRTAIGAQLRGLVSQLYGLSRSGKDVNDAALVEKTLTARLTTGDQTSQTRAKAALATFQKREQLTSDYDALAVKLREACQPKPHRFALTRL